METARSKTSNPRHCWAWRSLAAKVVREEMVCRHCRRKGRTKKAVVADHIIPLKRRPDLLLSRRNIQALCSECHRQKTAREHLQVVGSTPLKGRRRNKGKKRYLPVNIQARSSSRRREESDDE